MEEEQHNDNDTDKKNRLFRPLMNARWTPTLKQIRTAQRVQSAFGPIFTTFNINLPDVSLILLTCEQ